MENKKEQKIDININNEDKAWAKKSITTILAWGFGGALSIIGAGFLIAGVIYHLPTPDYYIVGGGIFGGGMFIWLCGEVAKTIKDIKLGKK